MKFFQGIEFHKTTLGAGAVIGGTRNEDLFGDFPSQAVEHSLLGDNHESLCRGVFAVGNHPLRGADFIG